MPLWHAILPRHPPCFGSGVPPRRTVALIPHSHFGGSTSVATPILSLAADRSACCQPWDRFSCRPGRPKETPPRQARPQRLASPASDRPGQEGCPRRPAEKGGRTGEEGRRPDV